MDILVCWIGISDLRASAGANNGNPGPTAQALKERAFSSVALLNDHGADKGARYTAWLRGIFPGAISRKDVKLASPMNIEEVYKACREAVEEIRKTNRDAKLTFHVSPGTPAMAAVWMLMSARYGADLIESSPEHGVNDLNLPFDISASFLPDKEMEKLARAKSHPGKAFEGIRGNSPGLLHAARLAEKMAPRGVTVLIEGESGTGKELFARAIHDASQRAKKPFVALNCGAIPRELVEAQLFGAEKGSFTGAVRKIEGHFSMADTGTLFLDELGELPLDAQVKLLRVLETGEFTSIGASQSARVDVRIIAATNRNLLQEVAEGRFRSDLFYRLAVGIIRLPPLRERGEDVRILLEAALDEANNKFGENGKPMRMKFSEEAKNVFIRHTWPGNVRELKNTVARAAMWADGDIIDGASALEAIMAPAGKKADILDLPLGNGFRLEKLLEDIERSYIKRGWEEGAGVQKRAQELLGYRNPQNFTARLKKYGLYEPR